jgi:hypothetical protein
LGHKRERGIDRCVVFSLVDQVVLGVICCHQRSVLLDLGREEIALKHLPVEQWRRRLPYSPRFLQVRLVIACDQSG